MQLFPVPEQLPPHPVKVVPEAAFAVSVTLEFMGKVAPQVPGQLFPLGLLVTDPEPTTVTERLAEVA